MSNKRKRRRPPLDERHYSAIDMLITGEFSRDEIACKLNVSRMTLWRWMQRTDFKREMERRQIRRIAEYKRNIRNRAKLRSAQEIEWFFRVTGNMR